jgi:hypothetical protein
MVGYHRIGWLIPRPGPARPPEAPPAVDRLIAKACVNFSTSDLVSCRDLGFTCMVPDAAPEIQGGTRGGLT